ncbi:MAG: carbon-nitrogen hydrolase family protein [Clostridia bacterium]
MEEIFKVAILQMERSSDIKKNIEKGVEFCKEAKIGGADIAVFPEMWSNGYERLFKGFLENQKNLDMNKVREWQNKAIDDSSEYIETFISLAKELKMAIAITYLEKTKGMPQNTVMIIDRRGEIILKYAKVHTVDFKEEIFTEPGREFKTAVLDYGRGRVNIGAMICYDREFPESARILMIKGAEIVLVPNACLMTNIRLDQLKVRAYENMIGIVTVNYANLKGRSSAYSPIIRNINREECDNEIIMMDEKEAIGIAEFNLSKIRDYRKREFQGDTYRKPYAYKELISNNIQEVFKRKDARRLLIKK